MTYKVDSKELRKAMINSGFTTIEDLANASGVNRNTISAVLNGETRPTSTIIDRLSVAMELSGTDIGRIFFSQELA